MKNYLKSVVTLTFIIALALIGLHYLPPIYLFGKELRTVDILADIVVTPNIVNSDSVVPNDVKQVEIEIDTLNLSQAIDSVAISVEVDTTKQVLAKDKYAAFNQVTSSSAVDGLTHIIDYSDSTHRGMLPFYEALDQLKAGDREHVRIAFFGDSFVEADILTADLRNELQKIYGGSGVGIIPITSEMQFFRRSVRHSFKGWSSYSVTQKPFDKNLLGISGEYFIPTNKAYVEYSGQSKYKTLLDTCQVASLFYQLQEPMKIVQRVNGKTVDSLELSTLGRVAAHRAEGNIGKIRWNIPKDSTAVFFAGAMDGDRGIILDNFGQRGSSGYSLTTIPYKTLVGFNQVRPYDLIILEYGLNVVSKNIHDYSYYKKGLSNVIKYLKQCFPNAGFLIVSVGDRDVKDATGAFNTMPEIFSFLQAQHDIAKNNKIAFWNMFEAMGGENSMVEMVKSKPAKANLDYTHINFLGGKFMAGKLFEALVDGKERFDKKEVYIGEVD